LRYFTLTLRKNEGGTPSGAIVALAFPSAVRVKLTVRPSEENSDSFNSAAHSAAETAAVLCTLLHQSTHRNEGVNDSDDSKY